MEPNGMITGFCSVTCEMRGEGTYCESISCQQPLDTPPASREQARPRPGRLTSTAEFHARLARRDKKRDTHSIKHKVFELMKCSRTISSQVPLMVEMSTVPNQRK